MGHLSRGNLWLRVRRLGLARAAKEQYDTQHNHDSHVPRHRVLLTYAVYPWQRGARENFLAPTPTPSPHLPFVKGKVKSAKVRGSSLKATAPQGAWRDRAPALVLAVAHRLHPAGVEQSPPRAGILGVADQRVHMACIGLASRDRYADEYSAPRLQGLHQPV